MYKDNIIDKAQVQGLHLIKYILRYQDRIRADIQSVPDNEQLKLIKTIELTSMVREDQITFKYKCPLHLKPQVDLFGQLLDGSCVQKSQSYCPGCVKFKECEISTRIMTQFTFYCWNLGRPCQDMQSWFTEKIDLNFLDQGRAIVISGGENKATVEYFSPDNSLPQCKCSLPSLPGDRRLHTMNGLTVCAGYPANNDNCMTLRLQGWETSHNLSTSRYWHVAWRRQSHGILLMGGVTSETYQTTEMAGQDGTVTKGPFGLKNQTRQVIKMQYFLVVFLLSSSIANMFIN